MFYSTRIVPPDLKSLRARLRVEFRRRGAVYLVLFLTSIPAAIVFLRAKYNVEVREAARFEAATHYVQAALAARVDACIQTLYGIQGLFAASRSVEPEEWERFLMSIRAREHDAAVLDFGYAQFVRSDQKAAYHEMMRQRKLLHTAIFPESNRLEYCPVVYLNVLGQSELDSVGFDLLGSRPRRAAMEQARDTGRPAATERLTLFARNARDHETGFVIYLPVYQEGAIPKAVAARQAALSGFVFASFRSERLWRQILADSPLRGIDFEVYDSSEMTPDHLLYDEDGHVVSASRGAAQPPERGSRRLESIRRLAIAGQTWTLRFTSLPAFEAETPRYIPYLALLGALLINAAIFAVAWVQSRGREVAERLTEDLQKSQERRVLVERATNDAIWDWDLVSNRIERNAAARKLLDCPAETAADEFEWWKTRIHPDDRPGIIASVEEFLAGKREFWAGEYRFRRSDGTYLTLIDRAFLVRDETGRPLRMIGSMLDITERLKIEEEKRQALRLFETLVNHTPDVAVQIFDREGRVTLWNAASERLYGYQTDEINGRRLQETILPPGEVAAFEEKLQRVWHNQRPDESGEWSVWSKGGSEKHVYSTMFPILRDGKCEAVCCMDVDITARRTAERALEAEKERLAITLRAIAEGVIATDTSGGIVLMNRVAETLTGHSQSAAKGRPLADIFQLVDARTHQPCGDPVTQVLQAAGAMELSRRVATLVQPLGEWMISYSAAPIRDPQGILMGVVLVFRDISDEQRMAEERLRASKLESVGLLAGGIAHDFNNILTVIIGNLSFVKLSFDPGDDVLARLNEAEKASLRAKDLTRQLLTFAKGGAPIKEPTSLAALIQESTGFALSGANVRCEFAFAPDLWPVDADPGQINQVIDNLVINAVQAMPEGGVLRVGAENVTLGDKAEVDLPAGKYVRVWIEDEGRGIPREHLTQVFDPYFTTKPAGSGLGLATAYSIITRHGGMITVDSAVGVGTTFQIYLPISTRPLPRGAGEESAVARGQGRILIMDDDDMIRNLASTMLRHLGYRSEMAADGEEAIRRYVEAIESGQRIDAVIIDLTIPGGMGGKETIQHLLKIDPNVKAIVSSGYSNDPIMADHESYGFSGVMAKPYKMEDLGRVLKQVLSAPERRRLG